jgi:hypothetical protein
MATVTTVGDIYNTVCSVLLEDWDYGASPGLSLGIVTQQNFLDYFGVVLADFIQKTGLVQNMFTQQVQFGVMAYTVPEDISRPEVCFVGGFYIDQSTLQELDDSVYGWRTQRGVPANWHADGLPVKTIELSPAPNYNGAPYSDPDPTITPVPPPPYGVYWQLNPADQNLTMIGIQTLTTNVFSDLAAVIPIVPDSFCHYLGYGVMAMIFSTDGEAKDSQRAAYCSSRYTEGVNLGTALSGRMEE